MAGAAGVRDRRQKLTKGSGVHRGNERNEGTKGGTETYPPSFRQQEGIGTGSPFLVPQCDRAVLCFIS